MTQHPSVMDITEDSDETEILIEYLNMRQKCLKDLCELTFLQDFPQNGANSNRRHIIKYMLDKYVASTCMINEHPDLLETFTFKFRAEDARVRQVTFSNHMQFRNDILMICFIQHLLFMPKYVNKMYNVMITMMLIMANKYDINIYPSHPDLYAITFVNISASYLSIHLDILYNNFLNFSDITHSFPYFNLPLMTYAPMIIVIFPILDNPPIAILMVISLILHEICNPHMTSNISLAEFYKRITAFYNTIIPEKIKLRLCTRYGIVVLEGDKFKFAPCFAKYRQKAKDILSEKRPNDPDLKDILSVI